MMAMNYLRWAGVLLVMGSLLGCASMSGLDGDNKVKCSADTQGMPCTPLSKVYEATVINGRKPVSGVVSTTAAGPVLNVDRTAVTGTGRDYFAERAVLTSGAPMRSAPRVLRIWIAPWEDNNNVLNDQKLAYLTIDSGRWLIEHNQRQIIDNFAPTRLVQGQGAPPTGRADGAVAPTGAPIMVNPGGSPAPAGANSAPSPVLQPKSPAKSLEQLGIVPRVNN